MELSQRLVGGHYQLLQHIGKGQFGTTYLGEDLHKPGKQYVAVKEFSFISDDKGILAKAEELFQREADILFQLNDRYHRGIPELIAYFREGQQFYLVEEFIPGSTLGEELKRKGKLEPEEVIAVLTDVLEVLVLLHSKNIIHRDIKPDNLIRREGDGGIVLIDFGAVKEFSQQQGATTQIYTMGYAPLEQCRGNTQLNSDIYALGMTALELLTGETPLDLKDPNTGKVIWPAGVEVKNSLKAILEKMVAELSKHRYESAAEVLEDLKQQSSTILVLPPVNSNSTGLGWSKKNALLVGLVSAVLVPFLLAFVFFKSFFNPDLPTPEVSGSVEKLQGGKKLSNQDKGTEIFPSQKQGEELAEGTKGNNSPGIIFVLPDE